MAQIPIFAFFLFIDFIYHLQKSSFFFDIQHGRYLETLYLEAGRDLGTSEADMEVGVL